MAVIFAGCAKHPSPAPPLPIAFRVVDSHGNVVVNVELRDGKWQEVKK
jgi:hypothetical protein